ncbi:lamin tail domain-containing protein [Adhaeribacter swui]|uniref:Lamin tail domain-containing protein n=1 Tax=Adhaeribacter swui TaxID=2086471 RepID=A0A7G7G3F7_9BACT|nr:lamin tail domain-containing protein [Adhaeribacter swui]QNF31691.1 lamin tail domain-containing protein [Adhaeribacter swui]
MRKILLFFFILLPFLSFSQLQDNFSDGNFSQDPTWQGHVNAFIVNAAGQLQSNGPAVTGTQLQLATASTSATDVSWEFWAQLNFATSASNYADVYLLSDSVNLSGKNSGYFVRLGGTADEVSLFRKDVGKSPIIIINGTDKTLASNTANIVRVKVTRSARGKWQLDADFSGAGTNYVAQGTVTDSVYRQAAYFGIFLKYSSANAKKFFFDDIRIRDTKAPTVLSITRTGSNTVDVNFSEPVSTTSAQLVMNYTLKPVNVHPVTALRDAATPGLVHLTFADEFATGTHTLAVSGIQDLYANAQTTTESRSFTYERPVIALPGDVRITEILADYSPAVGLPESEFFEIYNASGKTFNLANWKYSDATTAMAVFSAVLFAPGEYRIVCRATDTLEFKPFGKVIGLKTFPSLNDGGDAVELFDQTGKLIDKVNYTPAWYRSSSKAEGGWSLEIIDLQNPCVSGNNWVASINEAGGTPGKENSVKASNSDNLPPVLNQAIIKNNSVLSLTFNEKLDSAQSVNPGFYKISPDIPVLKATVISPDFTTVELTLGSSLQAGKTYEVSVTNIRDCSGNILANPAKASFLLPQTAAPGDVVINEILFNPRSGGVDFVEIVNRSEKYISLQNWQIGNMKADTALDARTINSAPFILAPQQYLVLTMRPDIVQQHYPKAKLENFLKVSSMPSFPDEAGTVVLLNPDKQEIDRVSYHEDMHFRLIDDVNGVSLERIRLDGPSTASNFHSAATSAGFATPGYRNSQVQEASSTAQVFTVEPKVFTPDGDGDRDFTTINYAAAKNGMVANVTVYDRAGRLIKRLIKNELLANQGFFQWDGTNDQQQKAPIGYYVLFIELFNLQGNVQTFKETVVVGGKL